MLIFAILIILKMAGNNKDISKKDISELKKLFEILRYTNENQNKQLMDQSVRMSDSIVSQISLLGSELRQSQEIQQQHSIEVLEKIELEMKTLNHENRENLEKIRISNFRSMEKLRAENQQSLDKINDAVNEKLQKTLDDKISRSFETVSRRLTEVYESLGEMKNVASGVSDLKNVLSNVKTRGIMGEIQLGAILDEILAPEQYGTQISVVPHSPEKVDFAVKLPGDDRGDCIYLPIDSKFPGDTYSKLLSAYESGNPAKLSRRRSALETEIKRCAKSISDKYIKPPYTTDFAIMFLPFEGLYAEVVNMGLVEILQRDYRINIAGPSTMAAMLNSLQMGFRTLAVHKKSSEVWQILEAAKKEFGKFQEVLESTRNRLRQADEELERLIGTRTRAINRRLRNITENDSESDIDTD
ncbi:MAG: DNA recombination protein RmuC [Ruminococcus sp.]|nr:DNA recombination protein RmuC [Ruminococcus sp.]